MHVVLPGIILLVLFYWQVVDRLQIVEAEEVLVVTEVVASEVEEVSVGETVAATAEEAEDSEVATRWEEGWSELVSAFATVVWLYDQKRAWRMLLNNCIQYVLYTVYAASM